MPTIDIKTNWLVIYIIIVLLMVYSFYVGRFMKDSFRRRTRIVGRHAQNMSVVTYVKGVM